MRTADLGQGWFANANNDGTFTLRNCDKGQRIDLTDAEAALFVRLWSEVAAGVDDEFPHVGPYHKPMREDDQGLWWWRSYKGPVGPHASREACEDNIRIHCGD